MNKKNMFAFFVFGFLILPMSFAYAPIDDFVFSISTPNQIILGKMNYTLNEIYHIGLSPQRFADIYNEASYYNGNDQQRFLSAANIFRNMTVKLNRIILQINKYQANYDYLRQINLSDTSGKLNLSLQYLESARYEESEIILDEITQKLDVASSGLFADEMHNAKQIEKKLALINQSLLLIEGIKSQLETAKKETDITKLRYIKDNLNQINNSIFFFEEINRHCQYFSDQGIKQDRIKDISDQAYYYFNIQKYDKIEELYLTSLIMYESAKNYLADYIKTNNTVFGIPKENRHQFEAALNSSFLKYTSSEFDLAIAEIDQLDREILDFETRQISLKTLDQRKISLFDLFKKYSLFIISICIILSAAFIIYSKQISQYLHNKKLKAFEKEKNNLVNIIKGIQEEYYVKKTISRRRYDLGLRVYQRRLVEVTKNISMLKEKSK